MQLDDIDVTDMPQAFDLKGTAMTYDEIRNAWNAQADDGNRWHSLSEAKKVEWAAIHAAAKARAWPVTVVLPKPVGALARDKDGVRISFHPDCTDKVRLRANLDEGLTGGPYRTEYVFSESQMRATLLAECAVRQAAQEEVVALKERIARAGVEQSRAVHEAVLEEREECALACEIRAGTASMFANSRDAKTHAAATKDCASAIRARP